MDLQHHKKELDRIASVEDYDDDCDMARDGEILLGMAIAFDKHIDTLHEAIRRLRIRDSRASKMLGHILREVRDEKDQ